MCNLRNLLTSASRNILPRFFLSRTEKAEKLDALDGLDALRPPGCAARPARRGSAEAQPKLSRGSAEAQPRLSRGRGHAAQYGARAGGRRRGWNQLWPHPPFPTYTGLAVCFPGRLAEQLLVSCTLLPQAFEDLATLLCLASRQYILPPTLGGAYSNRGIGNRQGICIIIGYLYNN